MAKVQCSFIDPQTDRKEFEALLARLTPLEIEELNSELELNNLLLPPSHRSKNQTDKIPTSSFDRDHLIQFLEENAKNDVDWPENKPYTKTKRGKPFVAKSDPNKALASSNKSTGLISTPPEIGNLDEILQNASEADLIDLAGILGFTGFLTQDQIEASSKNKPIQELGTFKTIVKSSLLKSLPDEQPNNTDVEESIDRLKSNTSELRILNLNNITNISAERFARICEALHANTRLESLSCANIQLNNAMAEPILEMLCKNNHLSVLNLESNYLTGDFLVKLLTIIQRDESGIHELRLCNQRQHSLGVKVEQELTALILANKRLRRLGIDLETADARVRISDHISSNTDRLTRQRRRSQSRDRI